MLIIQELEEKKMKKWFSIALALIFVLSFAGAALAEQWICPNCLETNDSNFCVGCGQAKPSADGTSGSEWTCPDCGEQNTKNFCANCGAKKPGGTSSSGGGIFGITCENQKNGETVITWKDSSGSGPYNVYFSLSNWNEYSTDFGIGSVKGTSARTNCLVPGQTYKILVKSSSSSATAEYTVPVYTFTDFASKKVLMVGVKNFNLSGQGYFETFKVELQHAKLQNDRTYGYKLVLNTPLGYSSFIRQTTALDLKVGNRGYYWKYGINEFMDEVKWDFGYIPSGKYVLEAYFDNALYAIADFTVSAP